MVWAGILRRIIWNAAEGEGAESVIVITGHPHPSLHLQGVWEKSLKSALFSRFLSLNSMHMHTKKHGLLKVQPSDNPVQSWLQFSRHQICLRGSPLWIQVTTTDFHYLLDKCKHHSSGQPGGSTELPLHLEAQSVVHSLTATPPPGNLFKKKKKKGNKY